MPVYGMQGIRLSTTMPPLGSMRCQLFVTRSVKVSQDQWRLIQIEPEASHPEAANRPNKRRRALPGTLEAGRAGLCFSWLSWLSAQSAGTWERRKRTEIKTGGKKAPGSAAQCTRSSTTRPPNKARRSPGHCAAGSHCAHAAWPASSGCADAPRHPSSPAAPLPAP